MKANPKNPMLDFKGIGFSKIGYFKEVRAKIKELEKLNLQLAQRGNRLEAIFNSMSDGLTILDRNLDIVYANRVQKTMFADITLLGQKCFAAYYRKKNTCRNCPALKTIQTRKTLSGEILVKAGEHSGRYLEWTTTPITDPYGRVEEIMLLMRDITERKEYEFKLMQADRLSTIGFLASAIAHEINNPLTSIAGFSEGLIKRLNKAADFNDSKLRAAFEDYLKIIHNEAYRCKDIIRNLQEFSRSSDDAFAALPIDRLIQDTAALFRQHAKDSNIRIIMKNELAAGLKQVLGNESKLKHVFLNVFHNTLNATERGGELHVSARNQGSSIEIVIANTRKYSAGQTHELFLHPSWATRPVAEVSTLDLSICHSIIQHHKGEFRFAKQADGTVIFSIRLPTQVDPH